MALLIDRSSKAQPFHQSLLAQAVTEGSTMMEANEWWCLKLLLNIQKSQGEYRRYWPAPCLLLSPQCKRLAATSFGQKKR
mmetsp:Transcript_32724/g.79328  ORF Transcript_32724/g.79328 Transcript_32724/m.79328 type:complete len:80 (+) Transcript_32724:757-996(+)